MKDDLIKYRVSESYLAYEIKKPIVYEILELLFYFLIVYPILTLILYTITKRSNDLYICLLLIFPHLIFKLSSLKLRRLSVFLLIHFIVVAIYLILPFSFFERIVMGIYLLFAMIFSMKDRVKVDRDVYSFSQVIRGTIILTIAYIVAKTLNFAIIDRIILIAAIVLVLLSSGYIFVLRTKKLMAWEKSYSDISLAKFLKQSYVFTIFIITAILFLVIVFGQGGLFAIADFIDMKIMAIMRVIYRPNDASTKLPSSPPITTPPKNSKFDLSKLTTGVKPIPAIIINILNFIFYTVIGILAIIAIIFIVKGIVDAIKNIYNNYYGKNDKHEETRESIFSFSEFSEGILKKTKDLTKKLVIPFNLTNNEKIRKLYKKLVIKNAKKKFAISLADSPAEIEGKLLSKFKDTGITEIYEKARYSKENSTKEELQLIKEIKKVNS
ncbi:MAG TPA: hypothetical protein VIK72_03400 [Clostridiaceae bacterium]